MTTTEEFDVIVIGAGVIGSIVAERLSLRDRRVLILEAGDDGPERSALVAAYVTASQKTMGAPYKGGDGDRYAPSPDTPNDYFVQDPAKDKFLATYQRRVGGSTWHWRGNTPRHIPNDFKLKSIYGVGVDWPLAYDDIEPWYCMAESEIGVAGDHDQWNGFFGAYRSQPYPMPKIWQTYSDLTAATALRDAHYEGVSLSVFSTPQARNSQPYGDRPACAGNSTCDPICPIGAKYDATVHVARAVKAGAVVRPRSVALNIHVGSDDRVRSVTYRTWDGEDHTVEGALIIVAAHAIETPKLLLMSRCAGWPTGIANSSDQVGRNLMDHLQGQGAALTRDPVFPFRGPPSPSGIDHFRDGPFRRTHSAFRLSLGNDGWGHVEGPYGTLADLVTKQSRFGVDLRRRLEDRLTRQFRVSYSTETLPRADNRVTLAKENDGLGLPRPAITFKLDDYNKGGFVHGRAVIQAIFAALGVTDAKFPDINAYSSANHILGTCRMGHDPASSVVDSFGRAHDHPNLFILGCSTFPTCGTANPTLTAVALALRSVDTIDATLPARPQELP